jgi:hypothetical protein
MGRLLSKKVMAARSIRSERQGLRSTSDDAS